MPPFYDNAPSERNAYDTTTDSPGVTWQPLRLPLQRLADRLHLQRATAIIVAEAAGIPTTEAD